MPTPDSWSQTNLSTLTGVNRIDALIAGVQWASGVVSISFPHQDAAWSTDPDTGYGPSDGDAEPWLEGYQGLFPEDQAATRLALAAWSAVADLQFREIAETATRVGDIRFAYVSNEIAQGAQAFAYYPDASAYAGDVWFNIEASNFTDPWEGGSYEYTTVLHELGHALGLKHPFEPETDNPAVLPNELDTRSFTLMSYSAAPGHPDTAFNFEPTTPMLLDIAAAQALYGANTSWHARNNTYRFDGDSFYHQTIWDAGGIDTIVLEGDARARIDLRPGLYGSRVGAPVFWEDGFGSPGLRVENLWIAFGTLIENASGGSGGDGIMGNAVANALRGAAGNDDIEAGPGADLLWGNGGADRLRGGADDDRLSGGFGADTLGGGGGADQFVFERAPGPNNIDTVRDFTPGVDTLVLYRSSFPGLADGATLDSSVLRSGDGVTNALDADDRILYDSATGVLYYDADGNGPLEPLHFASLGTNSHPEISATDFVVVA